jgi:hypothetical protein
MRRSPGSIEGSSQARRNANVWREVVRPGPVTVRVSLLKSSVEISTVSSVMASVAVESSIGLSLPAFQFCTRTQ